MVTLKDYIELEITAEMVKRAKIREENNKKNNKGFKPQYVSDGNFGGLLGEEMIADFYNVKLLDHTDYDFIYNEMKIDVKCLGGSVIPELDYEGSIFTHYKQKADFYLFGRVLYNHSKGWVLGYYPTELWWDESNEIVFFKEKGAVRESDGFVYKEDCRNILIENMYPLSDLFG